MDNINQEEKKPYKILVGIFTIAFILIGIGVNMFVGRMIVKKDSVWKTYPSSPVHTFTFTYPDTAKISEDLYGFLLVQHIEPFVPGTANGNILQPGYFIDMISSSSAKPIKSLVEERIVRAIARGRTIAQPLTAFKTGSYLGFTYSLVGKIKSTYIYLKKNSTTYGEIIYTIDDKTNKIYQGEIDKIIASFKFTN